MLLESEPESDPDPDPEPESFLESLSDKQILSLCELQLDDVQQQTLSDLLASNQEGNLNKTEVKQLDDLMNIYRRGTLYKAQALKIAVERGLKSSLK